jgi:hypothetical protein
MAKSIYGRVRDAFPINTPETSRSDAIEYCKALRETRRDTSTSMNRTLLVAIAVVALFYLSAQKGPEKMEWLGLEVQNLTAVKVALPVIFAYLYFEVILLAMRDSDMAELHSRVTEIAYPSVWKNDLELWLAPPSRPLLTIVYVKDQNNVSAAESVTNIAVTITAYSLLVLGLGFEISAYAFLFLLDHIKWYWILPSFVITSVLLAVSVIIIWLWLKELRASHRAFNPLAR